MLDYQLYLAQALRWGYEEIPELAFPPASTYKNQLQGVALVVENIGEEIKVADVVKENEWCTRIYKNSESHVSKEILHILAIKSKMYLISLCTFLYQYSIML